MRWPFVLDGKGFGIDPTNEAFQGPTSSPLIRAQADTGGRPGEQSLNREDFWRRTMVSWHHGAGQKLYDREGADPYRFLESEGIDPWTEGEIKLLNDTDSISMGAGTAPYKMIVVPSEPLPLETITPGYYIYYVDWVDQKVYRFFSDDDETPANQFPTAFADFEEVALGVGVGASDITTDGHNIYIAAGVDGVHSTNNDNATFAAVNDNVPSFQVWFVRNRLLSAHGTVLYNIISDALPATSADAIYDHPNPGWQWTSAAEAGSYIYIAGRTPKTSQIYKTAVLTDDGTTLEAPIIAAQLPDGELIYEIQGYAGFILIGTDKGVRLATPDSEGFLTYGSLLPLGPIFSFEGEGNYVWAGSYKNYPVGDDTPDPTIVETFLWRLDLGTFIEPVVPAYATDIRAANTTTVNDDPRTDRRYHPASIATLRGRKLWTQWGITVTEDANALVIEADRLVSGVGMSGALVDPWLETSRISFDLTDPKQPVGFTINHKSLPAAVAPATDDASVALTGTLDYGETTVVFEPTETQEPGDRVTNFGPIPLAGAEPLPFTDITMTIHLSPAADDVDGVADGPEVVSMTMKARPTPPGRAKTFIIPVLVQETVEDLNREMTRRDVEDDFAYLMSYAESGERVSMSLLGYAFEGYVEDYQFQPEGMTRYDRHYKGTMVIKVREV